MLVKMTSCETKTQKVLYEDKCATEDRANELMAYMVEILGGKKTRKKVVRQVGKDIIYFYEKNGVTFRYEIVY